MPNVARLDDANSGGGIIKTIPQSTVFANDKLISVDGSRGTGHPVGPPHALNVWLTANGSSTVTINNIPVNDQRRVLFRLQRDQAYMKKRTIPLSLLLLFHLLFTGATLL